jgi:hypothetical protein
MCFRWYKYDDSYVTPIDERWVDESDQTFKSCLAIVMSFMTNCTVPFCTDYCESMYRCTCVSSMRLSYQVLLWCFDVMWCEWCNVVWVLSLHIMSCMGCLVISCHITCFFSFQNCPCNIVMGYSLLFHVVTHILHSLWLITMHWLSKWTEQNNILLKIPTICIHGRRPACP